MIFIGICTTNDVDALLYHMNNARYLRELDFARADFYERTDLYREACSQGSGVVQGATTIRYRRFIKPLTIFKITSKVIQGNKIKIRVARVIIKRKKILVYVIMEKHIVRFSREFIAYLLH